MLAEPDCIIFPSLVDAHSLHIDPLRNRQAQPILSWNFRDLGPHEHGVYSFAFDTVSSFPTYTFENLVNLFPSLFFDCECIADDDRSMGFGWFNTPLGGQAFRDDYDVPEGYWSKGGGKRTLREETA